MEAFKRTNRHIRGSEEKILEALNAEWGGESRKVNPRLKS